MSLIIMKTNISIEQKIEPFNNFKRFSLCLRELRYMYVLFVLPSIEWLLHDQSVHLN